MNESAMKKTEDALLTIREELDNVIIPDTEILDKINPEMADIYEAIINLKNKVANLENQFGSLDQYGIADEMENLNL